MARHIFLYINTKSHLKIFSPSALVARPEKKFHNATKSAFVGLDYFKKKSLQSHLLYASVRQIPRTSPHFNSTSNTQEKESVFRYSKLGQITAWSRAIKYCLGFRGILLANSAV
jgi:hypothetical protein